MALQQCATRSLWELPLFSPNVPHLASCRISLLWHPSSMVRCAISATWVAESLPWAHSWSNLLHNGLLVLSSSSSSMQSFWQGLLRPISFSTPLTLFGGFCQDMLATLGKWCFHLLPGCSPFGKVLTFWQGFSCIPTLKLKWLQAWTQSQAPHEHKVYPTPRKKT